MLSTQSISGRSVAGEVGESVGEAVGNGKVGAKVKDSEGAGVGNAVGCKVGLALPVVGLHLSSSWHHGPMNPLGSS